MPASFSGLGTNLQNIIHRGSNVYVFDTGGLGTPFIDYVSVGEVRDVDVKHTPIVTSKSTRGRKKQTAVTVMGTFTMMQTTDNEVSQVPKILQENPFGTTIKFSTRTRDAAEAPGTVFKDALLQYEGEIKGDGNESFLKFSFEAEIDVEALETFLAPLVAGDALIGDGIVAGDKVFIF
ncbi:MAG: hypothetical protein LCH53_04235 [Bacteroidetes bacterium]|nr:hypothetical protein [Bacteroidota bacterium]